jgi:hypothetical protein
MEGGDIMLETKATIEKCFKCNGIGETGTVTKNTCPMCDGTGKLAKVEQIESHYRKLSDMDGWLVQLKYFKGSSGKFYTAGSYITKERSMLGVLDEVKEMVKTSAPGLSGNANKFFTLVTIEESHPNGFPCLILPIESWEE